MRFDISSFQRVFDFGIAQSVFTHMPMQQLNPCLAAAAPHFKSGGKFFVTMFLAPPEKAGMKFKQSPGGITTWPDRDPFHTTLDPLDAVALRNSDWRMQVLGDWNHPRNQKMVCFCRI